MTPGCHDDTKVSWWHLGVMMTRRWIDDTKVSWWHLGVINSPLCHHCTTVPWWHGGCHDDTEVSSLHIAPWCHDGTVVPWWHGGVIMAPQCHDDTVVPWWHGGVIMAPPCHDDTMVSQWHCTKCRTESYCSLHMLQIYHCMQLKAVLLSLATLKLLVTNISPSFPFISSTNTAAQYQRSVTPCGTVVQWHRIDNTWLVAALRACSEARHKLRIMISAYPTCIRCPR